MKWLNLQSRTRRLYRNCPLEILLRIEVCRFNVGIVVFIGLCCWKYVQCICWFYVPSYAAGIDKDAWICVVGEDLKNDESIVKSAKASCGSYLFTTGR